MKKHLLTICLILSALISMEAEAADCFKLTDVQKSARKLPVSRHFKDCHTFRPAFQRGSISGLSVDGSITKLSDGYFVRVLLKDTEGKEYVVLELYSEIDDASSIRLRDYCEETILLKGIQPDSVKVILADAELDIESINYIPATSPSEAKKAVMAKEPEKVRREQVASIADRINVYNRKHNKLWRAGVTSVSLLDYDVKKRVMGFSDGTPLYGYEYYTDGIFEMGGPEDPAENTEKYSILPDTTAFVDYFDWRNRHGRNWMTSVKDQKNSEYCTFFATAGSIEALANLYYNQQLDLNLSEQEMACCHQKGTAYDPYIVGDTIHKGMEYVSQNGVCNESAYPFVDAPAQPCLSGQIDVDTMVYISGYSTVSPVWHYGYIKQALINYGPLAFSHRWRNILSPSGWSSHSMTLVGYGTIHAGDTIVFNNNASYNNSPIVIPANDSRIGKNYWICKNSYNVNDPASVNGYQKLLANNSLTINNSFYAGLPITIQDANGNDYFTEADIVVEDRDGDGLYFWGLGPKPTHSPSWVPITEDGDDSDINLGEMNEYGHLDTLSAGITIKTPITYSSDTTTTYRLGIVDGGVLTITGTTTLTGDGHIRVCEGGVLIVDGGTINDADLTLVPGCTLILRNGGTINMASGNEFHAPKGAVVEIDSGIIN